MGWGSFFKKAAVVTGSVAIRSGLNVLASRGRKAQGRDFVDGVIGGLLFGRKDPITTHEVFSMAVDYATTQLRGRALKGAVEYARDRTYGSTVQVSIVDKF